MKKKSTQIGFSLIELIVAVAIIAITVGGGIAAFIKFNQKQQLLAAARELQQVMRIAQTKARVREMPADGEFGCDLQTNRIVAYHVFAQPIIGAKVVIIPICGTSLDNYSEPLDKDTAIYETTLPSTVTLVDQVEIDFLALYGGIHNYGSNWTYHLTAGGYTAEFTITSSGEISDVTIS